MLAKDTVNDSTVKESTTNNRIIKNSVTTEELESQRGFSIDAEIDPGIPLLDYEGSGYRQDFWEGQGRDYEDQVERIALRQLMPARGGRIAEIGAGFGRLADLYLGYEQIVLFDYSRTLLADAVRNWGHDERFVFVAGNLYQMPLAKRLLDTVVMVRVMHHLADIPAALAQLQGLLHQQGTVVLEYANKRNLKAILRWIMRQQNWSPFDLTPLEFVAMNFNFHPLWMSEKLQDAGLQVEEQYGVSHFRLRAIKRRVNAGTLARLDSQLFRMGGKFPFAPSIFIRASTPDVHSQPEFETDLAQSSALFRCPACTAYPLHTRSAERVQCPSCAREYEQKDQIWDFKLQT